MRNIIKIAAKNLLRYKRRTVASGKCFGHPFFLGKFSAGGSTCLIHIKPACHYR